MISISTLRLPTQNQCLNYFDEYKVPMNIKEHCLNVQKIAIFLAEELNRSGVAVNVELVSKAALLHDLFKVVAIDELKPNMFCSYSYSNEEIEMWKYLKNKYVGMHECEVAYFFFVKEFPELAKTIRDSSNPLKDDKNFEEEIIHYADWRILNNQIVHINQRLSDLKRRYFRGDDYWENRKELMVKIETKIFSHLNFSPEELKGIFENG